MNKEGLKLKKLQHKLTKKELKVLDDMIASIKKNNKLSTLEVSREKPRRKRRVKS